MVTTEELGLIIALGMCFAFLMGLGMVLLARKNRIIHELGERLVQEEKDRKEIELLHNTISTQETERNRIARRLHDEVGALLSIVSKNLSYVDDSFKKGNLNQDFFYNAVELLDESTQNLRNLFKELMLKVILEFYINLMICNRAMLQLFKDGNTKKENVLRILDYEKKL